MQLLLASLPILTLVLLVPGLGFKLALGAPIAFLVAMLVAVIFWGLPLGSLLPALAKSGLLTLEIILIIFGALFFIQYLKSLGLIEALKQQVNSISEDYRIQAIMLTWLLGSFIEGTSGFGTPAVIVAPILVGFGFPALTAILICLLANSTSVIFGAVGTPIRIGFSGLETFGVAQHAALINLLVGGMIPLLILYFVLRMEPSGRKQHFLACFPWTLFAGFSFLIPYVLFAQWGHEFPSLLGGAVGFLIVAWTTKKGFLVPREIVRLPLGADECSEVRGTNHRQKSFEALSPYALLLILLIAGRFLFMPLHIDLRLGAELGHRLQAFNPGFAFLSVVGVLAIYYSTPIKKLGGMALSTLKPLVLTAVSIFFVSMVTYTMILTDSLGGQGGMLVTMTKVFVSEWFPFYSPAIGALGSFLAGSATVSNLLFGNVQADAATLTGYEISWILALQLVGAGAGNMIALPNLLAVQAAVGIVGKEAKILRQLILPCLLYLFLAALVATLMMSYFN